MTEDDVKELVDYMAKSKRNEPKFMICNDLAHNALNAAIEFQGRDRRRIKREINKAFRTKGKVFWTGKLTMSNPIIHLSFS